MTPSPIVHLYRENDASIGAAVLSADHVLFQRIELLPMQGIQLPYEPYKMRKCLLCLLTACTVTCCASTSLRSNRCGDCVSDSWYIVANA